MVDPLSLAIGAALLVSGFVAGRIGRRRQAAQPIPMCPCEHVETMHTEDGCTAEIRRPYYDKHGFRGNGEYHYVRCACRRYGGPEVIRGVISLGIAVPPPPEVSR